MHSRGLFRLEQCAGALDGAAGSLYLLVRSIEQPRPVLGAQAVEAIEHALCVTNEGLDNLTLNLGLDGLAEYGGEFRRHPAQGGAPGAADLELEMVQLDERHILLAGASRLAGLAATRAGPGAARPGFYTSGPRWALG